MSELNYLQLINRAIGDFDDIFDAIKEKQVLLGDSEDTKLTDTNKNDGSVKTEAYAGLITRHLFRISGLTSDNIGSGTVISSYKNTNVTSGNLIYTRQSGTDGNDLIYNVTIPVTQAGYYDASSKLTNTITTQKLTFDTNKFSLVDNVYSYVVPENGNLVSKVDVAKGFLELDWTDSYSENLTYNSELKVKNADLSSDKYTTEVPADAATNWVALEFTAPLKKTGTVTVTPTKKERLCRWLY